MSPPEPAVRLEGVGKRYGRHWALRGVDLCLSPGEVLGFIGPNGAGKSTLIRLLAGLARRSEGTVEVLGLRLGDRALSPEGIGLVPESPQFIPYLSARRNLEFLAAIRAVAGPAEIRRVLELVRLDPDDRRATRKFSLGMRQRLGLAQALMERPRLLLLDEPTNGLDPAGIVELRGIVREAAAGGTAVFMASHLLTEVEQVCDRVILVRDGSIVKEVRRSEQRPEKTVRVVVSADSDLDALEEWSRRKGAGLAPADPSEGARARLVLVPSSTPELIRELVQAGVRIEEVTPVRRSLEREFLDLVGSRA
ncbi:MAG: ABC transporter ATP-binding protein [Actinomycetota bacterium]|nr:ABC transporter ATP-binding protein [Actinomycetota bacterium]